MEIMGTNRIRVECVFAFTVRIPSIPPFCSRSVGLDSCFPTVLLDRCPSSTLTPRIPISPSVSQISGFWVVLSPSHVAVVSALLPDFGHERMLSEC